MKTLRHNYSEDHLTGQKNKRTKSSENGGENALPISIDLVFEIFSRLPVKSIARCRCVSKIWASILRRREFTELFSSKSYACPKFLFVCSYGREYFVFSSPQPQNPDENSPPIIANYHMSFSIKDRCGISGVVNGLIFLKKHKRLSNGRTETVPVLCNPSTGESLPLQKVKTNRATVSSMLGYDPIDKGFKILSMTWGDSWMDEEHQVLTIGTDKWIMVDCCIPRQHPYTKKGICINGVMYYQSIYQPMDINAICCFDIRSEKFSFIKFNEAISYATLINYSGKLGLLWSKRADGYFGERFNYSSTSLRLWVLEDVERQEWSKRIIALPPLWKSMVGQNTLLVVGVTNTNEIVFQFQSCEMHPLCLFYLNTDKNTIVRVEIQGIDRYKYDVYRIFMNHVEDVKLF